MVGLATMLGLLMAANMEVTQTVPRGMQVSQLLDTLCWLYCSLHLYSIGVSMFPRGTPRAAHAFWRSSFRRLLLAFRERRGATTWCPVANKCQRVCLTSVYNSTVLYPMTCFCGVPWW